MICSRFLQDKDAQALKEDYAKARLAAQEKAAAFDKVREAARALNKELEAKNKELKDQEDLVARLAVCTPPPSFNFLQVHTHTECGIYYFAAVPSLMKLCPGHL